MGSVDTIKYVQKQCEVGLTDFMWEWLKAAGDAGLLEQGSESLRDYDDMLAALSLVESARTMDQTAKDAAQEALRIIRRTLYLLSGEVSFVAQGASYSKQETRGEFIAPNQKENRFPAIVFSRQGGSPSLAGKNHGETSNVFTVECRCNPLMADAEQFPELFYASVSLDRRMSLIFNKAKYVHQTSAPIDAALDSPYNVLVTYREVELAIVPPGGNLE